MATYRVLWLEIAEQQYMDLPHAARDLVDEILDRLAQTPATLPAAGYHEPSDQWSVPIGDQGFVFYAVVEDRATVIILRVIHILTT